MKYGRITDPAELAAYRLAYLPKDIPAQRYASKIGEAVAYAWTDEKKRPRAIAWLGKSQHPWSRSAKIGGAYYFKSEQDRRTWIAECFAQAASIANRRAGRRAEKAAKRAEPHKLAVGDILRASWGYDQTNIDYYQVTGLVGSRMVEVRKIGQQSEETDFMQGKCVPAPDSFIGEPMRRRVSEYDNASVKIDDVRSAYKVEPVANIEGVKLYPSSHWTSYA